MLQYLSLSVFLFWFDCVRFVYCPSALMFAGLHRQISFNNNCFFPNCTNMFISAYVIAPLPPLGQQ